ncbi:unnamed protein product [Penicillium nalgiovense]|uniref:Uncharacterized protein n=1 Tax=Penicillium nalgiovense TaxID=60175 RepID=A0A9W4I875_PENNA|nr:unnamed protein product [Penicillium nalgiovense]CAG7947973.1 unnamed protein product [Penicillium nalgiovense]CAG7962866.1 unnamed protein product [Penicillium nalgiovense]CAG7972569.1 unnamed protein product [Penicillium nalgiovense]CAG8040671.1 unnamed protein product [Penicillium nalgiovense]
MLAETHRVFFGGELPQFLCNINMIPPCDPSILEQNPQFKRLYENLTTSLLHPDASTRAVSASPARIAVVEELKQCQSQNAKKRIKEHMLRQLAFASDSNLPTECHDNLAIITLYLETPSSAIELTTPKPEAEPKKPDEALSLLGPDIEAFYTNIPAFILPFSKALSSAIRDLRALSTANTDSATAPDTDAPATQHSNHNARARARDRRVRTSMAPVPPLSSQLQARIRVLRNTQLSQLPVARRKMAATAAEVVAVRARVLERTVVILERAKHGALARATKTKAEHLAVVAQGVEGKLEVTKLEIAATLYTPETLAALARYRQHLRQTKERLQHRQKMTVQELGAYGDMEVSDPVADIDADEGTYADIARRYGVLAREAEEVKMEIARLER